MALDAGAVFVKLGAVVDDRGFDKYDREVARTRQESRRKIEQQLGAEVDKRGFDRYHAELAKVRASAKEKEAFKAHLGADYDDSAFKAYQRDADNAGRSSRNFGGASREASGGLLQLSSRLPLVKWSAFAVGGIAAAQSLISLVSALGPLVGLLGAVPGAASIAAQGIGSLVFATKGIGGAIGAALKDQDAGAKNAVASGKAAKASAEGIRTAELGLADAHRQEKIAQEGLTQARHAAIRELQDQRLAADAARLAEVGSALSLKEARKALDTVSTDKSSTALDVAEAQQRVDEAVQAQRQSGVTARRAIKDAHAGTQKGVSGNQGVIDAQRSLADSQRQVAQAQHEVAKAAADAADSMAAASSSATALDAAMAHLPQSAQHFVKFIVGLRPAFDDLRKAGADQLFPRLEKGITSAMGNLPVFRKSVADTSREFGLLGQEFGQKLGSKDWGRDLASQSDENVKVMGRLRRATLSVSEVLKDLMVSARPVLDWLSSSVELWAKNREAQTQAGRESGKLNDFFEHTVRVGKLVSSILQNVWHTLTGVGKASNDAAGGGDAYLRSLRDLTDQMNKWVNSARGQSAIKSAFEGIRDAGRAVRAEIGSMITRFNDLRRQGKSSLDALSIVFSEELSKAIKFAVKNMGRNAPGIAKAFVQGFLAADIWGKLFVGGWLLNRLGGGKAIGRVGSRVGGFLADYTADAAMSGMTKAGGKVRGAWQRVLGRAGGGAGTRAGEAAVGSAAGEMTGAASQGKFAAAGKFMGRHAGKGVILGIILGLALLGPDLLKWVGKEGDKFEEFGRKIGRAVNKGLRDAVKALGGIITDAIPDINLPGVGSLKKKLGLGGSEGGVVTERGIVRGYADGGMALDPRDTIPAMLRKGEGVLTPEGVAGVGGARGLNDLNRGRGRSPLALAAPLDDEAKRLRPVVARINDHLASVAKQGKQAGKDTREDVGKELKDGGRDWLKSVQKSAGDIGDEFTGMDKASRRSTGKMADNVTAQLKGMRTGGSKQVQALAKATSDGMEDARKAAKTKAGQMRDAVGDSYSSMDRAVFSGVSYVRSATSKALEGLGQPALKFSIAAPKAAGGRLRRLAGGGFLGNAGDVGHDSIRTAAPEGSSVVNRHQMPYIDALVPGGLLGLLSHGGAVEHGAPMIPFVGAPGEALLDPGQTRRAHAGLTAAGMPGGLDGLFANVTTPHYLAAGGRMMRRAAGGLRLALGPYEIPPIHYAADHAGGNSHLHIAMETPGLAKGFASKMAKMGWAISEATWAPGGVKPGVHSSPEHYDGRAFDANTNQDETRPQVAAVAALLRKGGFRSGKFAGGGDGAAGWTSVKGPGVKGPAGALRDLASSAVRRVTGGANKYGRKKSSDALGEAAGLGGTPHPGHGTATRSQMVRWATEALHRTGHGAPPDAIAKILELARKESGWNIRSENTWDSNARAGNPSVGLMQVTLDKVGGSRARGFDPVQNMIASINYQYGRYGGLVTKSPYARGGRMASGGMLGGLLRRLAPGGYTSGPGTVGGVPGDWLLDSRGRPYFDPTKGKPWAAGKDLTHYSKNKGDGKPGSSVGKGKAAKGPKITGKVSWFDDSSTASGWNSNVTPGVAISPHADWHSGNPYLSHKGKGWKGFWGLNIHGRKSVEPQIDLGPNWALTGGRKIDVGKAALGHFKYNGSNFPTDAVGSATWLGTDKTAKFAPGGRLSGPDKYSAALRGTLKKLSGSYGMDVVAGKIAKQQTLYDHETRRYDVDVGVEDFVVTPKTGSPYLNEAALKKKEQSLARLVAIRKTQHGYVEAAIKKTRETIAVLRKAIARLQAAVKRGGKDRPAYQKLIRQYTAGLKDLKGQGDALHDLEFDTRYDMKEIENEAAGLRGGAEASLADAVGSGSDGDLQAQLDQANAAKLVLQKTVTAQDQAFGVFAGPGDIGAGAGSAIGAVGSPMGVPGAPSGYVGNSGLSMGADGKLYMPGPDGKPVALPAGVNITIQAVHAGDEATKRAVAEAAAGGFSASGYRSTNIERTGF